MPRTTLRRFLGVQFAGGVIVQEHERLGALGRKVVHTHGDEVDADRFVAAAFDGDSELGSDAIGRGQEDRVLEAGGLGVEDGGESAQSSLGAGAGCGNRCRLNQVDKALALVDIDASVTIGQAVGSRGYWSSDESRCRHIDRRFRAG